MWDWMHLHGLAIWTGVGPLVGVLVGATLSPWLAWRWQHKQWVMDHKKQEYKELLDGLYQMAEGITDARPNVAAGANEGVTEAVWKGARVLHSRIFIARRVREANIDDDWGEIMSLALWEPNEPKIKVGEKEYQYTTGAIGQLRSNLEDKLLKIVQDDLKI